MTHHQVSVYCADCNGTGIRLILIGDRLDRTFREKCRFCNGIGKRLEWID